jgi:hypothetical protein
MPPTEAAYMDIRKLSAAWQDTQLYVISSNFGLRGSESISLIWSPHLVHGTSVTRKCAHVGVGRGVCSSMAASRHQRKRNATNRLVLLETGQYRPLRRPLL